MEDHFTKSKKSAGKEKIASRKSGSGGKRPGAGRKGFSPTSAQRKLIEQLSACGINIDEMPVFVVSEKTGKHISEPTLRKYFKKEIDQGRLKANAKVANSLYRNATESSDKNPHGNIIAQIFWLKARAGWRESAITQEIINIEKSSDAAPPSLKGIDPEEASRLYSEYMRSSKL